LRLGARIGRSILPSERGER
jgi:hypothetical protein